MKKIYLTYLTLLGLTFIQCREPHQEFSNYEINPLKESIVKNKVTAYLEYGFVDGNLEMGDSVSFDRHGNITSKISKGGWVSEQYYTYDSLNRLVFETQRSDIFNKIWTQYELHPESKTIVKYVSIGNREDSVGELILKEFIKFDIYLNKILVRTSVDHENDSTITRYEYEGDKIKKESEEVNGHKGQVTEYIYEGGQLRKIKRQHSADFLEIDYVSKTTGLIDSTWINRQDDAMIKHYKYY